jgi:hypothetical protein
VFRGSDATEANLLPGVMQLINSRLNDEVSPEDYIAYVVGLVVFPRFSEAFNSDLVQGGVRIPLCLDSRLIREVGQLGSAAVHLFTYGERQLGSASGRESLRLPDGPQVVRADSSDGEMPVKIVYDESTLTLRLGAIEIAGVQPDVWSYEVSGMPVVKKWFGYRKASPAAKWSSPLNDIVTTTWPEGWTEDLLDLLHVITRLRSLEERHAQLLAEVRAGPLLDLTVIQSAGLLPPPTEATKPKPVGTLG